MTCCFLVSKHKKTWFRLTYIAIASLAALIAAANLAGAASGRKEPQVTSIQTRAAGEPIMAIVSLRSPADYRLRYSAKAALDRIAIPQDTLDQIAGMVSPRSSLIISDEALSSETGRGTEFVVLMSGEPQGGIKHRRRSPEIEVRYQRPNQWTPSWRSPYASPYSTW